MSELTTNKKYKNGSRYHKFRSHGKKKEDFLEDKNKTEAFNNSTDNNGHKLFTANTSRKYNITESKNPGTCTDGNRKNKKNSPKNRKSYILNTNSKNITTMTAPTKNNNIKDSARSFKTSVTKDFTFKNGKENKKQYIHIGTQTLKPIQIHINKIFNEGFETASFPPIKEETLNLNNLHQNEETNIWVSNDLKGYRRNSVNITGAKTRKWSNASTTVGYCEKHIPDYFRKSSSISSCATITDISNITNICHPNKNDFSTRNKVFFKDPYLIKEPLTIEDLNSTNVLRMERDIKRLKSAIDKKNYSDIFCIKLDDSNNLLTNENNTDNNTEVNNSQCNDKLTTINNELHSNILMDIWLDYPACCYNSFIKE